MRDVDRITELLPNHMKVEWRRRYKDITPAEKIRLFVSFMKFLDAEREAISRMFENQPKARFKKTSYYVQRESKEILQVCVSCPPKGQYKPYHRRMQRIPEASYKWKEWKIPTVEGNQCLLQMLWKSSQTKLSKQSPM